MHDITSVNKLPLNRYCRQVLLSKRARLDHERVHAMQLVEWGMRNKQVSLIENDRYHLAMTLETMEGLPPHLQMKVLLAQDDPEETSDLELPMTQLREQVSPRSLVETLAYNLAMWAKYHLPDWSKVPSRQELAALVS